MAVAITRPSGRRADDVRALRFRFRTLTFSGNYATGGETVLASTLSLKRILAVLPADGLIHTASSAAGVLPVFDVAADGRSVVIRAAELGGTGAAGDPFQEKTNAEAYVANSFLNVLVVGE